MMMMMNPARSNVDIVL